MDQAAFPKRVDARDPAHWSLLGGSPTAGAVSSPVVDAHMLYVQEALRTAVTLTCGRFALTNALRFGYFAAIVDAVI